MQFFGYKPTSFSFTNMELENLRKSFSYKEPCLRRWELVRTLRKLAIKGESIIQNDEGPTLEPPPSLAIISKNYEVLKGYTSHMADSGVICTRLIPPLEKAVVSFYDLMERDVNSDQAKSICHKVAKSIKKMLGAVRRKWFKWEMPRESQ